MSIPNVTIDIISDIVCPWCYIGFKRLQLAMSDLEGTEFTLRWQPFELNPDLPEEGQDLQEHMTQKYGSTAAQTADSRQLLKAVGMSLGIEINHVPKARIVNTFRAHQLLHWAESFGKNQSLQIAMFERYFGYGCNLNDIEELAKLAAKVGLDPEVATKILQEETFKVVVRQKEAVWLQRGVRSVPTYIFNDKFALSGAREPGEIVALLKELAQTGQLA